MGLSDFLKEGLGLSNIYTWLFFRDMVLLPVGVILLGTLLGGAIAHRIKAAVRRGRFADAPLVGSLLRSLGNLPAIWGFLLGLNWAAHTAPLSDYLRYIVFCVLFTLWVWSAATFLQRALCRAIETSMGADGGSASTSLLLNLVGAVVYIIAAIIVLDAYGVSITPLLTALGVGGMAIALGLQDTMANLFAGLHILLTKQIRIGDHIRLEGGSEGQIIDITWRFAKIHTVTNNIVIVPNNKLAASIITNYDMGVAGGTSVEDVAFTVTVGVAYDSDLDGVEHVTLETAREVLARLDPALDAAEGASTAPSVRFHTFGDSSVIFNVNLHTSSFRNQYLIRHEFIKALKKRFEDEGIVIPFPIRTVRTENGDALLSTKTK